MSLGCPECGSLTGEHRPRCTWRARHPSRGVLNPANNPMCTEGTPVDDHVAALGLYVKREDLCCPGGPNFSKTRGVYAHVRSRPERVIGVLDTSHSQGGWAVARACKLLDKQCRLFYPSFKAARPLPDQQKEAYRLGASLHPIQAGRSAVLYHKAKKLLSEVGLDLGGPHSDTYMMPNALKLPEMITETVAEVARTSLPPVDLVLVSASSGTIAAGVRAGLYRAGWRGHFLVHMGYSRSMDAVNSYMKKMELGSGFSETLHATEFVDEKYEYKDKARPGEVPPFPCNDYYDLKLFRWWSKVGRAKFNRPALLWNIG